MEKNQKTQVTVETTVAAPVEKVWDSFTNPDHITKWCQASEDWHAPYAENDIQAGGKFKTTMAAKDGSFSFDFEGMYDLVELHQYIAYTIADGRKVAISFQSKGNITTVSETFETEEENPVEMQRGGWQAILDSFKNYTENLPK